MAFRSLTGAACCKNKVPGWKLKYVNVKKKQIYNELNSVASKQCFLLGSVWWAVGLPRSDSARVNCLRPNLGVDWMPPVPHRWPPVAWAPGTSLACKVRCLPDFLSQPIFGCLNFSGRGGKPGNWKPTKERGLVVSKYILIYFGYRTTTYELSRKSFLWLKWLACWAYLWLACWAYLCTSVKTDLRCAKRETKWCCVNKMLFHSEYLIVLSNSA